MSRNNLSHSSFASRIKQLNNEPIHTSGDVVIYLAKNSLRTNYNHALEYATIKANELNKPLLVLFLLDETEFQNERHLAFLLEGLLELEQNLKEREIAFFVHQGTLQELNFVLEHACYVVLDKGYTKQVRQQNKLIATTLPIRVTEVESNTIVPVEVASKKEEYAAYTLRPKLNRQLTTFLQEVKKEPYDTSLPKFEWLEQLSKNALLLNNITNYRSFQVEHSVKKSHYFKGGETSAQQVLTHFIKTKLEHYDAHRNDPEKEATSNLSPYLKFGFLSPLDVYFQIKNSNIKNNAVFLEQLLVRRELGVNFVYYNENYDSFKGLPTWAKQTLEDHMIDKRPNTYTLEQLEQAKTNDPYWNAAQQEMVRTGKMHNYMRMYWAKRLLEWFHLPMHAFDAALYLNNKYCLDGYDPNSYAGVAWCFGKHDRPWFERPIFGLVRYMNANGLKNKFNMNAYLEKISKLT
jgi:deoxyribodipyrimidine photo-lyase